MWVVIVDQFRLVKYFQPVLVITAQKYGTATIHLGTTNQLEPLTIINMKMFRSKTPFAINQLFLSGLRRQNMQSCIQQATEMYKKRI